MHIFQRVFFGEPFNEISSLQTHPDIDEADIWESSGCQGKRKE
jgi:hypothetical protein